MEKTKNNNIGFIERCIKNPILPTVISIFVFLFGFLVANKLNVPFVLVRKAGKLPYKTVSVEYDLEYGTSKIEMHEDALKKGWTVYIHDDLLATGGTASAAAELVKKLGAEVAGFNFVVGLDFLNGKSKLVNHTKNITCLVHY